MREVSEELSAFDLFEQFCIQERMRRVHEQRRVARENGEGVEPHFLATERVLLDVRMELDPLFLSIQERITATQAS